MCCKTKESAEDCGFRRIFNRRIMKKGQQRKNSKYNWDDVVDRTLRLYIEGIGLWQIVLLIKIQSERFILTI